VLNYDVVDVFTDRAFAGNPLAVVHGAGDLDASAMQAIAREFNLSETAFPLAPTSAQADYRVRIFTPQVELPFAGHPSVGTAWVLARDGLLERGDVVQECGAGMIPLVVGEAGAVVTGGAPRVGPLLDGAELAAAVGLDPADIDPSAPAGIAEAGLPFAYLAVRPDAVGRAYLADRSALRTPTPHFTGVVVLHHDAADGTAHVRMFGPGVDVDEDPATGAAAVGLGVWLVDRGLLAADGRSEVTISQGAEIGRPSRLELTVDASAGAAVRTSVGGGVVPVAHGQINPTR
jgi:trans-2,3-dihydro-3-hydroxyanthranilate isomerase